MSQPKTATKQQEEGNNRLIEQREAKRVNWEAAVED